MCLFASYIFLVLQVPIHWIPVPVRAQLGYNIEEVKLIPMIYPHDLWHWLVTTGRVKPSMEATRNFWSHFRDLGVEWATLHPATAAHHPCGLYGATYDVNRQLKLLCFLMNVILHQPLKVALRLFPIFALRSVWSLGHRSLQPFMLRIRWSLNLMFHGVFPHETFEGLPCEGLDLELAGTPIAGGMLACLTEIRGDWKAHKELFSMR
jgi:hypothetical protein